MNPALPASPGPRLAAKGPARVPRWLKLAYSGFMAVLIPVYWDHYGPTNFLYFCDVALLLTLAALWWESPLLAGMAAVGIVVPQLFWALDFGARCLGLRLTGMTEYMFESQRPLFTRGLSLFHGWLPFLLLYLVARLGYDRRALAAWCATGWALMLVAYCWMPAPGTVLANPMHPVNINYVFGLSDDAPQRWMPPGAWLALMMTGLPLLAWVPAHFALARLCGAPARAARGGVAAGRA